MTIVVFIIAVALIGLVLMATVPPATLAVAITRGGPLALMVAGGALMAFRQPGLGGLLLAAGFALRRRMASAQTFSHKTPADRRSSVRTAALEMELDHETGGMDGIVLAGRFEGRELRDLDRADLLDLRTDIRDDGDSMALLDAYLDRRFAGWREDTEADTGAGQAGPTRSGTMSEEEAYEVLGLARGADLAAIRSAHRRLMKDLHPDRGGSTFLAAKINEAKDVLMRSHS